MDQRQRVVDPGPGGGLIRASIRPFRFAEISSTEPSGQEMNGVRLAAIEQANDAEGLSVDDGFVCRDAEAEIEKWRPPSRLRELSGSDWAAEHFINFVPGMPPSDGRFGSCVTSNAGPNGDA